MTRRDRLNRVARRQLDDIAKGTRTKALADRVDIVRTAHGLGKDLGVDLSDVDTLLAMAEFLDPGTVEEE